MLLHTVCVGAQGRFGLAVEEARRAFDQQAADMTRVRDRAISLLTIGGLAATFIGGLAATDNAPLTGWTWAAVAVFVVMTVACIWVIWPKDVKVAFFPHKLVEWAEDDAVTPDDMDRDLALRLEAFYDENKPKHSLMIRVYCGAIGCLVALVLFLVLDLRSR